MVILKWNLHLPNRGMTNITHIEAVLVRQMAPGLGGHRLFGTLLPIKPLNATSFRP